MSLVGDALRKARREAAARDAERRGVLYSARISDPPSRSSLGLGLVLGAVIAVVATAAGGSVAWWLLRGGETAPVRVADGPSAPGADGPAPIEAGPEGPVQPGTGAAPTPDGDASAPSGRPGIASSAEPAPAAAAAAARPSPAPPPVEAPASGTGAAEPAVDEGVPQGFTGLEDGNEVYILEADLGGGRVLSLDYIVSRSDDPFAEVNGVEVHLGGVVSGFRVKAIEHDRVVLSDGRRTVVLRTP